MNVTYNLKVRKLVSRLLWLPWRLQVEAAKLTGVFETKDLELSEYKALLAWCKRAKATGKLSEFAKWIEKVQVSK